MVNYRQRILDKAPVMVAQASIARIQTYADNLWQEYVEGLDERKGV